MAKISAPQPVSLSVGEATKWVKRFKAVGVPVTAEQLQLLAGEGQSPRALFTGKRTRAMAFIAKAKAGREAAAEPIRESRRLSRKSILTKASGARKPIGAPRGVTPMDVLGEEIASEASVAAQLGDDAGGERVGRTLDRGAKPKAGSTSYPATSAAAAADEAMGATVSRGARTGVSAGAKIGAAAEVAGIPVSAGVASALGAAAPAAAEKAKVGLLRFAASKLGGKGAMVALAPLPVIGEVVMVAGVLYTAYEIGKLALGQGEKAKEREALAFGTLESDRAALGEERALQDAEGAVQGEEAGAGAQVASSFARDRAAARGSRELGDLVRGREETLRRIQMANEYRPSRDELLALMRSR